MNNQPRRSAVAHCMAALMGLAASTAMAMSADEEGWIAFDGSEGQIRLDAEVNGEPAGVIIDSTANTSAISVDFANRADIGIDQLLEFEMGGAYSNQRIFGSRRFELQLNEFSLNFNGLPVIPSGGFDMILGHQIFGDAVIQIDYPNQRFRFLSQESVEFESNVDARKGHHGELQVAIDIEGNRAWLTLDTGLSGPTMLTRDFVVGHELENFVIDVAQPDEEESNEEVSAQLLRFDSVEVGPYRFEEFLAAYGTGNDRSAEISRSETGTRIRQDRSRHDGLLGYEILRNFLITADFSNGKLHLHLP